MVVRYCSLRFRYFGKDETSTRYTAKARSIMFNLRDPTNPDLRRSPLNPTP